LVGRIVEVEAAIQDSLGLGHLEGSRFLPPHNQSQVAAKNQGITQRGVAGGYRERL
jgi:hypothetical protein